MTAAGLVLTLRILERTGGLELSYNPTFTAFADNTDLNYWRHAASLTAWHDITRTTRLEFTNAYLETEDPTSGYTFFETEDPLIDPTIGIDPYRRGRARYRTNTADARLSHQFGPRDRVYVAMRHDYWEDIDTQPGVPVADYQNYQPSFGLAYWFTQKWGTEIEGYYSNRDYEDDNDREEYTGFIRLLYDITRNLSAFAEYRHTRLEFDQDTGDDYHIYYPSAGLRYQFQETSHIRVGAGYYIQDFDNRSDKNEGWSLNSEIYKRWAYRNGYIDAIGASGYEIADTGGAVAADLGLTIFYQGRLAAGYNFTPRLSGDVYFSYRHNDYPEEEPDRSDQILDTGLGLRYQALQWMYLGLRYRHRDFASDVITSEYTENRVTLTITITPTSPYRWN
jgi:hypothetical protein